MLERLAKAAMFLAAREFDDDRAVLLVIAGPVTQELGVIQAQPLDEQIPKVAMGEILVRVGVQAGMPHARQKAIFLEPGPQHRKVIQLDERADVKANAAGLGIERR